MTGAPLTAAQLDAAVGFHEHLFDRNIARLAAAVTNPDPMATTSNEIDRLTSMAANHAAILQELRFRVRGL